MTPAPADEVFVMAVAIMATLGVGIYLVLNETDKINRKLDEINNKTNERKNT